MLIVERQALILDQLREQGAASLDDLAARLDVSNSTVRRDLDALEARGLVERTHGGAVITAIGQQEPLGAPTNDSPPKPAVIDQGSPSAPIDNRQSQTENHPPSRGAAFAHRLAENTLAKQAIGRYVASLVQPNMTLLMDAGSTVVYAAQAINVRPIQIATTSLAIANHFANDDGVEITLVGGTLYPRTAAMVGPLARQALRELYADLSLMSLAGLDETGVYNINLDQTRVERLMIEQSSRNLLLMDGSKFGRKSLVRVCEPDAFDQIVTDPALPDPDRWHAHLAERLVIAD